MSKVNFNFKMAFGKDIINNRIINLVYKSAIYAKKGFQSFINWYFHRNQDDFFSPPFIILIGIWIIICLMHLFYVPMF